MDVLGRHGPDAKILSGGMTLILVLKIRLAEPSILVDVNGISDLEHLREEGGQLHVWGVDA
jgi:carbon-monoxide dehydrogenase medium subunit